MEKREKVLVPVDGSEISDLTVKRAGQWSKRYDTEIILLTVLEEDKDFVVSNKDIPDMPIYKEGETILEKAKNELEAHGVACRTRIEIGPVVEVIVRIAEKEGVFAIIMGSRGKRGLKRMLLGSTADDVIRYAHCPVTIIR